MKCVMTFVITSGLLMMAAARPVPQITGPAVGTREIEVTAKRYEFNPNEITVKKGEHVKLVITALDRDHGFKLEAFGIDQKLLKGAATTIEFTPDRAGTFPFQCSNYCGMGHRRMKGTLTVEEGPRP
jgi:cytochrome c oxidase subunit II